ncbi:winged helix-turn-helix transcriptional regulator [Candidatus Palauibacter sp.]|uniref:winged helix-turn-helix transcriptional regulator n=1 Tax=Candidatus Palauibacter sp. TaxID=3101350 RepID=UPI003B52B07C
MAPARIDERDSTILTLLKSGESHGTREVAEAIGLSTRSTRTRLARLVERGLVREVGTGPHDPKRVYVRSSSPGADDLEDFRGLRTKR